MKQKLTVENPKTPILYDANLTNLDEINQFIKCILRLAAGDFRDTKKLENVLYYGNPVFRAKDNRKHRVIYTFAPTLCILATTPHKYEQLRRRFATTRKSKDELPELEILELPETAADILPNNLTPIPEVIPLVEEFQLTAAVPYKEKMMAWDEVQLEAHSNQKGSIILRGLAGAGKTLVAFHNFLRYLSNLDEPNSEKTQDEILFIAPHGLIKTLSEEYAKSGLKFKVRFITWNDFLASLYPKEAKPTTEEDFRTWLAKSENWLKNHDSGEIHYELSLIAALGSDEYYRLGKRQSYFARNRDIQDKLISILAKWQQHLQDFKTFDPMVTVPKVKPIFLKKFMDETQNLPPTALAYLVGLAGDCIASLDSEQCLDSSPFIDNFLKGLFTLRYGKAFKEILLEDSYRNPPKVFAVGASVLQFKHKRDTIGYRQMNKNAQSRRTKETGLVSWIDKKHQVELKQTCSSATTVVVVIANVVSDSLREKIKKELNCNNIIPPKDVIGLEFENVILYEPISQSSIKGCAGDTIGLSLLQLKDLSAVYVAVTRAEENVYILDDEALKRWPKLAKELFGQFLPLNELAQSEIKSSNKDFEALALKFYEKGQIGNAKEILRFNLQYDEVKIQEFFAIARAKASPVVPAIPKEPEIISAKANSIPQIKEPENILAKADAIPQIPKMEINPTLKTTLLKLVNDYFDKKQPEEAMKIMRNELGFSEDMIETILKSKGFQNAQTPKTPLAKSENQKKDVSKPNTIFVTANRKITEAQIQRSRKLWANFNKENIQSELAEPDCEIILFESSVEIFVQCLKKPQKLKILSSAIEEVSSEVADKLLSVISTKNMPSIVKVSMIKHIYMKETNTVEKNILHKLFEKLSPSQKVAFIVDCNTFSQLHSNKDNAVFSMDPRTVSLLPDEKAIKSDSKALISLLCKPLKYLNCSSYAAVIADLERGAGLITKLIDEKELFEFITSTLYEMDSFASPMASIFAGLCSHNGGLNLLKMLYKRDPTLEANLTIFHLMIKNNNNTPIIFDLYKNPNAHPFLNELTTSELAADYPHGLPETLAPLLNLSATKDGIKVIKKIMNAQPFMILQMNGFNLTCAVHNYYPIFTLLSAFEEGISILHQVLDFHKKNFVKHMTVELMYSTCNIFTPPSTTFQILKKSAEGKLLLERLKSLGWTPLTSQNLYAFFGNEAARELIDLEEDQHIKNALLSSNPWQPD